MFNMEKTDFLICIYVGCIMISELMGLKTFPIATIFGFHVHATVIIFILPLVYAINDIVVEVHGKQRAQSIVRSSLVMVFFLFVFSILATKLPPSDRFRSSEGAYETVFSVSARIAAASLIAFAISEFTDVLIFARIRQRLGKRNLWLRTNVSNFISEGLDTVLFMTLAFWATNASFSDNVSFIEGIALPYWLLRCGMSIIETPLVYVGVRWLRGSDSQQAGQPSVIPREIETTAQPA